MVVEPVLEAWNKPAPDFPNYDAGTWGPHAAIALVEGDVQEQVAVTVLDRRHPSRLQPAIRELM